jgi:hypothetical protein
MIFKYKCFHYPSGTTREESIDMPDAVSFLKQLNEWNRVGIIGYEVSVHKNLYVFWTDYVL